MIEQLVFKIPGAFAQCIADGSCQRYGTIIKNSAGTIVGHIQESGALSKVISYAPSILVSGNPITAIATAATLALDVGATINTNMRVRKMDIKLDQVMTMVESLKTLSFVNIGVSTLGLGVSVAGFYLMNNKLNGLGNKVDELSHAVKAGFIKLHQAKIREHISAVQGLLTDADVAHHSMNAANEYVRIAQSLDAEYAFFHGEISFAMKQEHLNLVEVEQLIQLMSVAHNARTRCLILADEYCLARSKSEQNAEHYGSLFDDVDVIELTHRLLATQPESDFMKAFNDTLHGNDQLIGTKDFIANMREVRAVANSKSFLIDKLIKDEVPGKLFFDQLSHQKEPIVVISN